jgi:hypothetical protein
MLDNAVEQSMYPSKPVEVLFCEECGREKTYFFDKEKIRWRCVCNPCKYKKAKERNPSYRHDVRVRQKQRNPNYRKEERVRQKQRNPNCRKKETQQRLERDPDYYTKLRAYGSTSRLVRHPGYSKRIPLAQYRAMVEAQGGVCAACKQPETEMHKGRIKTLSLDHNHITGEIRGLLCTACNKGIGYFRDDPAQLRAAADYLERWNSK